VPATGGYESWVIRPGSGTVTSPAPASVSGYVLDKTGAGISGATLTLTGTTTSGQSVKLTFTSNPDGSYTFTNLQPGTYSVSETPPPPYVESSARVGTVTTPTQPNPSFDGTLGATGSIDQIVLGSGTVGVNYDFIDVIPGG
jgi:hypothetical protein